MKNYWCFSFFIVFFLYSCGDRAAFVLPEGYEGGVLVELNQPKGMLPTYTKSRYVFEVDTSGVLISRGIIGAKWLFPKIYYRKSNGDLIEVLHCRNYKYVSEEKVMCYEKFSRGGALGKKSPVDTLGCDYRRIYFELRSIDSLSSDYNQSSKMREALIKKLIANPLRECLDL